MCWVQCIAFNRQIQCCAFRSYLTSTSVLCFSQHIGWGCAPAKWHTVSSHLCPFGLMVTHSSWWVTWLHRYVRRGSTRVWNSSNCDFTNSRLQCPGKVIHSIPAVSNVMEIVVKGPSDLSRSEGVTRASIPILASKSSHSTVTGVARRDLEVTWKSWVSCCIKCIHVGKMTNPWREYPMCLRNACKQ